MTKISSIKSPEVPVLIVDDNPQYTQLLKRILAGAFGYKDITTVENTVDALAMIEKDPKKFQLLFIDYRFPDGHTGGELLTQLNQQALMDDRVAFLITSEPTLENQKQALKAGARGVVAKPFDRARIQEQLDKAERVIKADRGESF